MSSLAIKAALEMAVAAMQPALPTAWDNVLFTPQAGEGYQRVHVLFAPPVNPEIGGGQVTELGFMQISLYYPLSMGAGEALARAELIRSAFKRGTSFEAQGVVTTVSGTPEIASSMESGDFYLTPVRIPFFSNYQA